LYRYLCVCLVSFATIILCVAPQQMFVVVVVVVVDFVINSVQKPLGAPSYTLWKYVKHYFSHSCFVLG